MALTIKQAIALGAIGVVGLGFAAAGIRGISKTNARNDAIALRERAICVHNHIHSEEYLMGMDQYLDRFGEAFRYVHSYRHGHVPNNDKYEILMSQFALMLDEDVSMLLAAGLASTHMFADYSDVYKDQTLVWNAAQTRYTSISDFINGAVDSIEPSFPPNDLVTVAGYIRHQTNANRELRLCTFVKEQANFINKILDGEVVVGKAA
jgi:hypothetical protein